jgi:hypothetical protein
MFLYFCSQRHNFSSISKSFFAFEAYFWYLFIVKGLFTGNVNGGLVQDGVIFKKANEVFFSICKNKFVVHKQCAGKKIAKKKFKMAEIVKIVFVHFLL